MCSFVHWSSSLLLTMFHIYLYYVYVCGYTRQFDINKLHAVLWFQEFLSNTDNYMVWSDCFYQIIVIYLHTVKLFTVTNNNSK